MEPERIKVRIDYLRKPKAHSVSNDSKHEYVSVNSCSSTSDYLQLKIQVKPVPIFKARRAHNFHLPHDQSYMTATPTDPREKTGALPDCKCTFSEALNNKSYQPASPVASSSGKKERCSLEKFEQLCSMLRTKRGTDTSFVPSPVKSVCAEKIHRKPLPSLRFVSFAAEDCHNNPTVQVGLHNNNVDNRGTVLVRSKLFDVGKCPFITTKASRYTNHKKEVMPEGLKVLPKQRTTNLSFRRPSVHGSEEETRHNISLECNSSKDTYSPEQRKVLPYSGIDVLFPFIKNKNSWLVNKVRRRLWRQGKADEKEELGHLFHYFPMLAERKVLLPKIQRSVNLKLAIEQKQKEIETATQKLIMERKEDAKKMEEEAATWQKCEFKVFVHKKEKCEDRSNGNCFRTSTPTLEFGD